MPNEKPQFPVLYSAEKIRKRVAALGSEIAADYAADTPLYLIGVLKGSFIFLADLIRAIPRPVRVDFIGASTYGEGTTSSGKVTLTKGLTVDISGADVLLVEDIVDTGITLNYLLELLVARNPKSVRVVSLLAKPDRHEVNLTIDYLGFSITDTFVVGYGMDHGERFRDLPDICSADG